MPVTRALLSVSDKTGLVDLGRGLVALGVELLSTGGSARALAEAGVVVREVSDYTGFPELMAGRLKTLHPKIHGGILQRRGEAGDRAAAAAHGLAPIDLVVVNLYPFEATIRRAGVTRDEAVEQIDIGGPALIRAAAKNHRDVTVVVEPADYARVLRELLAHGDTTEATRRELAVKAFRRTAEYDQAITAYLATADGALALPGMATRALRYGENSHQQGFLTATGRPGDGSLAAAAVQGSKECSFNNYLDADAAWALVREFADPAVVIVKHGTPCGVAMAAELAVAFAHAYEGDPLSAYGGVLACNRPLDAAVATAMTEAGRFFEVAVAPTFEPAARETLAGRRRWGADLRLLATGGVPPLPTQPVTRFIDGGYLTQTPDRLLWQEQELRVVTRAAPSAAQLDDLRFAMTVCAHVRSNAITVARDAALLGAGGGQPSRVDAVELALKKAGPRAAGAVLASDAFFPFPDGLERAAAAGIAAVVQPGGAKKDDEAVAVCDAHGIAMIFTGVRHFRH